MGERKFAQMVLVTWPRWPLGRLKPNFMRSFLLEWKSVQMVLVTWPRWPPCSYMVKTLKYLISGTKKPMTLKVGMEHWVLKYYQISWNDDPGLTLTYFIAMSNLVNYTFVWENGKTIDISEAIVVYAIKVGRCSQLKDYMNHYEYQWSRSFIDLCPRTHKFNIFKLLFLKTLLAVFKHLLNIFIEPLVESK